MCFSEKIGSTRKEVGFHGYIAILVGLHNHPYLQVFVRIELIQCGLIPFSSIRTSTVALGKNLLITRVSNKGAVSFHLDLHVNALCPSLSSPLPLRFICCHLAADTNSESKLDRRNHDA